jgi:serine/threonine-protein kinase
LHGHLIWNDWRIHLGLLMGSLTMKKSALDLVLATYSVGVIVANRFRLDELIGHGGEYVVFRAIDEVGSPVAVGITGAVGDSAMSGVRRIARSLGRIQHPAIAQLIDTGKMPDERGYVVTQWVSGIPLAELMSARKVTLRDGVWLTIRVLEALRACHDHCVIHRDIKPANVIVPFRDGGVSYSNAVLIDFGIAVVLDQVRRDGQLTTGRLGNRTGTVFYCAPEQLSGQPQSASTDIYALSMILYEIVMGNPATQVEIRAAAVDSREIRLFAGAFVTDRLTLPIALPRDARAPDGIWNFFERALQINPMSRYKSASDALVALTETLHEIEQLNTRPNWPTTT